MLTQSPVNSWQPLSGPQMLALTTPADELFYGGAAGGGKSDLLLGCATTQHRRAIIFRREYPQLSALVERSREIIGGAGQFNEQKLRWRIGSDRLLEFGAMQLERDKENFQGRPHDFIGFDEVTGFLPSQVIFVSAWLRTTTPGQRCRIIYTGNPPTTPEGRWIVEYFAPWLDPQHKDPAAPGELRWFAMLDGKSVEVAGPDPIEHRGQLIYPRSRTFIPAKVEDNPHLLSTGYVATLQGLPEPLRSQLLFGDFAAGTEDDPWQVIPTEWVRLAQQRWQKGPRPGLHMTALGVDVARGGRDKTVLAARHSWWYDELDKHPGSSTPNGPAVAALVSKRLGDKATAMVDVIGVGASVYDCLQAQGGLRSQAVNFAGASKATDKTGRLTFANKRAELYWKFREALDPATGQGIALPPDAELLTDLCAPKWGLTIRGIQVESKEDIIKRLGRSPDCADAVILASELGGGIGFVDPDEAAANEGASSPINGWIDAEELWTEH